MSLSERHAVFKSSTPQRRTGGGHTLFVIFVDDRIRRDRIAGLRTVRTRISIKYLLGENGRKTLFMLNGHRRFSET